MTRCDAELCPFWAGHGCVCDALDLEPDQHDCTACGHPIARGDLALADAGPVHITCPDEDDADDAGDCPGPVPGHGCNQCRSDQELHPGWYVL